MTLKKRNVGILLHTEDIRIILLQCKGALYLCVRVYKCLYRVKARELESCGWAVVESGGVRACVWERVRRV